MVGRYRRLVRGKQVRIDCLKETQERALIRSIISATEMIEHTLAGVLDDSEDTDLRLEIVSLPVNSIAMYSKIAVQTHRQIPDFKLNLVTYSTISECQQSSSARATLQRNSSN